jgi:hypothetical protein
MASASISQATLIVKEWILSYLDESSEAGVLLVHPRDSSPEDQQWLASELKVELSSLADVQNPCSVCCSIWGGIDSDVENNMFRDEQTLFFVLEKLVESLRHTGICIFAFEESKAVHSCQATDYMEALKSRLEVFGISQIRHQKLQDGSLLLGGKKVAKPFSPGLRVGLALSDRKSTTLLKPDFRRIAESLNVQLVTETGHPVDVAIFKADSEVVPSEWSTTPLVDVPKNTFVLHDRLKTMQIARTALKPIGAEVPWFSQNLEEVTSFPVVAKPNDASLHSDLWFVDSPSALNLLPVDVVWFYQKIIDHNAVIFKVSVIGSHVSIARRPSAIEKMTIDSGKLSRKDNQHSRKKTINSGTVSPDARCTTQTFEQVRTFYPDSPAPSFEAVTKIAMALQQCFELTLFGFDLISETGTDALFVVDINYFPSFVDVPGKDYLIFRALAKAAGRKE